jgi:hypothetical protein
MMRFNVVLTFENIDEDDIDIDLHEHFYSDEEKFTKIILNCLGKEDIRQLIKFTVFQYSKNESEAIKWLIERDGTIYFNYYENENDDTRRFHNFRLDYLRNRIRE